MGGPSWRRRLFVASRPMLDVIFLISGTVFFLLTAAYADGCDRL